MASTDVFLKWESDLLEKLNDATNINDIVSFLDSVSSKLEEDDDDKKNDNYYDDDETETMSMSMRSFLSSSLQDDDMSLLSFLSSSSSQDDDMSLENQALTEATNRLRAEIEQAAVSFLQPEDDTDTDDCESNISDDIMLSENQALTDATEQLRAEIEQAAVSFLGSKETDDSENDKSVSHDDKRPLKLPACYMMPLLRKIAYLRCTTGTVTSDSFMIV